MINYGLLQESGYIILIADKGFYSMANLELLENLSLKYIIPAEEGQYIG